MAAAKMLMTHRIMFKEVDSDWFEALPIGNGKFGAMFYYRDNTLSFTLNHYDLYYQYPEQGYQSDSKTYSQYLAHFSKIFGEDYLSDSYNQMVAPRDSRAMPLRGSRNTRKTASGSLKFDSSCKIKQLSLEIEAAEIILEVEKDSEVRTIEIFMTEENDCLLFYSKDPLNGWIVNFNIKLDSDYDFDVTPTDYGVEIKQDQKYFLRAQVPGQFDSNHGQFTFEKGKIFTEIRLMMFNDYTTDTIEKLKDEHQKFWTAFWKTSISIPDKYLETLWYLYLYLIKASDGEGSKYDYQASGLNGLWDIENNTLWRSEWYWDVNIQSTYWGTFSSNHLSLAKRFVDGYLQHEDQIRKYTKEFYGKDGWAIDYPHHFYNCIQPWCAQFLFWYYEYTNDENYLKKVLPVFQAQCDFILGTYSKKPQGYFFPDVSPEQGPLTADSTITIATVRYLFTFTIESLEILGQEVPDGYRDFLAELPEYTVKNQRLMDSPYTKEDQWLRHPSVLMPVFPVSEKDFIRGGKNEDIARNSCDYVAKNSEYGVFTGTWIASAYTQLGMGNEAIQTLYNNCLDHFTHSNGLAYEESERWVNLCIITKPSIKLPAMMDPTGAIINILDEMLIQKHDDNLYLFAALPEGKTVPGVGYISDQVDTERVIPAWKDGEFTDLLIKGGHRVSAQLRDGKLVWLKVVAGKDEKLNLVLPSNFENEIGISTLELHEDEVYEWGSSKKDNSTIEYPLRQENGNLRYIFLGKDRDTEYIKRIDGMIRPYILGQTAQYPLTVYKFDFGNPDNEKNYQDLFHRQIDLSTPRVLIGSGYHKIGGDNRYSDKNHFGISQIQKHWTVTNTGVDELRKDAIFGVGEVVFDIDLIPGRYTLLLGIGGDQKTSQSVHLGDFNTTVKTAVNEYRYLEIPISHPGGLCQLSLVSEDELPWSLNFCLINKDQVFY